MNQRWEDYMKRNGEFGQRRLDEFVNDYKINLDKALTVACVEDQLLLAYLIGEVKELRKEVKKLARLKKKVVNDD